MTRLAVLPVVAVVALALAPVACGSGSGSPYQPPSLNGYGDGGGSSSGGADGSIPHADGGEAGTTGDGSTGPHPDGGTPDGAIVPPTTCPATFTLPDASYTTVVLDTDYGNWTNAIPLTKNGTTWQVVTQVPYDTDVEYKFVADGTWMTAPGQPVVSLPSQSGTNVNNILQGVTCGLPAAGTLQLVGGAVTTGATSYSFQVKYVPGAADLDPSKTVVTLNGAALAAAAVPYDAASHTFTVSVSSGVTSPNKYGYLFQVADTNGMPARLFVPFWVEAKPYDWTDAFLYEVMVDRFVAGGTSKVGPNGPPTDPVGDWKGGDFGGVTQKIDAGYFDAMGVNTLWLSSPVLGTK
ncbi:MAG TPA: hypothetical protein VIY73_24180, partial [Polyangiaceae bacterium]